MESAPDDAMVRSTQGLFTAVFAMISLACSPRGGTGVHVDQDAGVTHDDTGRPMNVDTGTPFNPGAGQIQGRVTFPEGTLPVAGAYVLVPPPGMSTVPRRGECGQCIDTSDVVASTTTNVNGEFTLAGVPAGSYTVVIRKGLFERVANVTVGADTTTMMTADQTRLPRNGREGQIPRIALITGDFDHLGTVFEHVGLSSDAITTINGGSPEGLETTASVAATAFLLDDARMQSFDLIFVECGALIADDAFLEAPSDDFYFPVLENPTVRANLRRFVERGGRLFVTDRAYTVIEAFAPERVDFMGASSMAGTGPATEPLGSAWVGLEGPAVTARVMDDDMQAWLSNVGASTTDGNVTIDGFIDGWAVVSSAHPTTRVLVRGPGTYADFDRREYVEADSLPMTLSFESGCGRVVYSSYHVNQEGTSTSFTAQEKILGYLTLEIATCIENSVPPLI